MLAYHDLLNHILANGVDRADRTGTGTRSVFGYQMRFDLNKGFPVTTTKKLHLRSIIVELLWFLKGDTNIQYLKDLYHNSRNNYEKLNIFRLLYDQKFDQLDGVLRKFINESYHIENELISQLDPYEYEMIPYFIIEGCDQYVSSLFSSEISEP